MRGGGGSGGGANVFIELAGIGIGPGKEYDCPGMAYEGRSVALW